MGASIYRGGVYETGNVAMRSNYDVRQLCRTFVRVLPPKATQPCVALITPQATGR
jgi:predicted GTPase